MRTSSIPARHSGLGTASRYADRDSLKEGGTKRTIRIFRISALLIMILPVACSRSSGPLPEAARTRISTFNSLAYLPPKSEDDAPKEFITELDQKLQSELKNRGYILLDQDIVKLQCPDGQCQNLPSDSHVDALARFTLNKVRRINALIGHFNEVAGTLTILNPDGTLVTAISEIIRDRGGLLFNAGQVLKGIVSTLRNTAQEKYALLGAKLARNLALQLPIPEKSEPSVVSISAVTASFENRGIKATRSGATPEASTICLNGTPNQIARLEIDRREINMIELSPGRYCRTIATEILTNTEFSKQVELRSTFGTTVRQAIPPLT